MIKAPTESSGDPPCDGPDHGSSRGPTNEHEAAEVLSHAECVLSDAQVHATYDRLARDIQRVLGGTSPIILVCMVGGFIPAAGLLARMDYKGWHRQLPAIYGAAENSVRGTKMSCDVG